MMAVFLVLTVFKRRQNAERVAAHDAYMEAMGQVEGSGQLVTDYNVLTRAVGIHKLRHKWGRGVCVLKDFIKQYIVINPLAPFKDWARNLSGPRIPPHDLEECVEEIKRGYEATCVWKPFPSLDHAASFTERCPTIHKYRGLYIEKREDGMWNLLCRHDPGLLRYK